MIGFFLTIAGHLVRLVRQVSVSACNCHRLFLQELVVDVAVVTSFRHADLS